MTEVEHKRGVCNRHWWHPRGRHYVIDRKAQVKMCLPLYTMICAAAHMPRLSPFPGPRENLFHFAHLVSYATAAPREEPAPSERVQRVRQKSGADGGT